MNILQSKISATSHTQFITVDRVAAVKGQSLVHTRRSFKQVKVLAGLNLWCHSIHIDIFLLHAPSIPAFCGLKREDFFRIR